MVLDLNLLKFMVVKFTPRETDVLLLLCKEGLSNDDIAKRLQISCLTVKRYIEIIRDKLRVKNRVQVVVYFYQENLGQILDTHN